MTDQYADVTKGALPDMHELVQGERNALLIQWARAVAVVTAGHSANRTTL